MQVWDAWPGTKGTLNPWSFDRQNTKPLYWQLSVYISISSCCPGFIHRGPFHKLIALPIIFSKILAHLGTLKEAQIGLEPLHLPNFFNMQTSIKSQWKYWIFHELAKKTTSSCLLFLVLVTPTYICAHPGIVPETSIWKQIFLKAFSKGSHCQTFQKYIKKGDFDYTYSSRKFLTNLRQFKNDSFLQIRIYISHIPLSVRVNVDISQVYQVFFFFSASSYILALVLDIESKSSAPQADWAQAQQEALLWVFIGLLFHLCT